MSKRVSKADREAAQKAELRQRLYDMARGAHGQYSADSLTGVDEGLGIAGDLGPESFGRWLSAIEIEFCKPLEALWHQTVKPSDLHKFDRLDSAVKELWDRGVRP